MKTLLIIAHHPELPEAIRAILNPDAYRVVHRLTADEAEPLVSRGMVDVCLVDADLGAVQGLWVIERLRRRLPACPILVYTGSHQSEFEEEAYLQGVAHVLTKPVRGRMLNALLDRLWTESPTPVRRSATPAAAESARPVESTPSAIRTLEVLRDFSGILTHSLCCEALLKEFLLLLREILGVNRAVIFLRQTAENLEGLPSMEHSRRMRSACAIGLASGLLEHFELSCESGVGGHLFRHGRILRRESQDALLDLEVQKEFELLGTQVAVPILDRETFIGVAVFDGRVTGEALANGELELVFHLLEELGLAVKNIWLHDQLVSNHELMSGVLRELSSACVVISRDLAILHANKAARNFFQRAGRRGADLEFSDLPQVLGAKVYQTLKTGTGLTPFKFNPPDAPENIFRVNIVPFQKAGSPLPESALLLVEDITQTEQFQKLEVETANLRLVKTIAGRLAHEIGNALVPISTYQQLFSEKYMDSEFRASFDAAMAQGVRRVARLTSQMRYLAREEHLSREAFPLAQLVEEAFREAQKSSSVKSAFLKYDDANHPVILAGDRGALKHAVAEILLNAIQANPSDPKVNVQTIVESDATGHTWMHLDVHDNGGGFAAETAAQVTAPFFTTRTVGLGLGLTVSRKIIETHQGNLLITPGRSGEHGNVRISLPLQSVPPHEI